VLLLHALLCGDLVDTVSRSLISSSFRQLGCSSSLEFSEDFSLPVLRERLGSSELDEISADGAHDRGVSAAVRDLKVGVEPEQSSIIPGTVLAKYLRPSRPRMMPHPLRVPWPTTFRSLGHLPRPRPWAPCLASAWRGGPDLCSFYNCKLKSETKRLDLSRAARNLERMAEGKGVTYLWSQTGVRASAAANRTHPTSKRGFCWFKRQGVSEEREGG
jgi:hypothetical protein